MSRCYVPRAAAIGLLSLLITLLSVLAGCSLQKKRTIKIVTSFPMQGIALGKSVVNAVQLAIEDKGGAVLTAIERTATPDRRAILNVLTMLGEMQDVGGRFRFDINGDTTITTVSGNVVRNGTFEYLGTLAP